MRRLSVGEVFTLLDKLQLPYSEVLMDSYGLIRERRILREPLDAI